MVDSEEGIEEEFVLAQQMKDDFCDKSGRETDPAKAAKIIHQIGLIYRKRSHDKISLIKSAGLFNAAIIRNPTNVSEIKSDLIEICQHVLQQAKANNPNADLVKKGELTKTSINEMRKEVDAIMETSLPKIPADTAKNKFSQLISQKISVAQKINKTIADKYKQIMSELSQFCESVMGKPPCKYAIVGMGSLAREEITPYSDFEHVILLFDSKTYRSHLEYFKWYSVIFHFVVLTLQETIIPSLNVCSLNDKNSKLGDWYYDAITPRGVSFDGMMPHACKFPLGRQKHTKSKQFSTELIKPVSEMLKYLSSEADLKNGYHLADILTKTCFVFGNEDIFKTFVDGVTNLRNKKSQSETIKDVQQQVKHDLNSFSTRFRLTELKSHNTINIKQLVYRSTTIFIAALARIYSISSNSCFDIVNKMANNNKISQNTAEKLKCAVAIACEMRLRVYMKNKSQCDNAINLKRDGIEKFLDIVGESSTVNYFQIAYCLQCEVGKLLNFTKLHFYSNPDLINITIGLAFGIKDLADFSKNTRKRFWKLSEFNFDTCIEHLEAKLTLNTITSKNSSHFSGVFGDLNAQQIKTIANNLSSAKIFDEALEFYKQLLDFYLRQSTDDNRDTDVAWANNQIGVCLNFLNQPTDALTYLYRSLEIKQNITRNAKKDKSIAETLHGIGCSYNLLNTSYKPLTYLNKALEIRQCTSHNANKDRVIAATLDEIGIYYYKQHNYQDALATLNQALQIKQNITNNAKKDGSIGWTLHWIGCCYISFHKYNDALACLNQSLAIRQNISSNAKTDKSFAATLHEIGHCNIYLHNFADALTYLHRALEIKESTALNAEKDKSIAVTLLQLGRCLIDLKNYNEALTYLNRALQIRQNISLDSEKDRDLAATQRVVGRCLAGLQQYDDSWKYLETALKRFLNTTLDTKKDRDIADTFNCMGECLMEKENPTEAVAYMQRALEIYQTITTNVQKDTRLATTFHNIGICMMELQEYANAANYLKQSVEIYKIFPQNDAIVNKISIVFSEIEECSKKLG